MIVIPILAIVIGFLIFYGPMKGVQADEALARYTAIAILAGLDTIVGGLRAWATEQFDNWVFVSGFIVNAVLAVGLVALGEHLGLETGVGNGRISVMMIGAVVVFSMRLLNNLAALRRLYIERWQERRQQAPQQDTANPVIALEARQQKAS